MVLWDKIFTPSQRVATPTRVGRIEGEERKSKIGFRLGEKTSAKEGFEKNEDAVLTMPEQGVFGIFDGMGGRQAGEIAARKTCEFVRRETERISDELSVEKLGKKMAQILIEASKAILAMSKADAKLRGMGTTASVVKLVEDANGQRFGVIANVGDSRVYVQHLDGTLEQITLDDGVIREVCEDDEKDARRVQKKLSNYTGEGELDRDERFILENRRFLSQSIGSWEDVEPRIDIVPVKPGERFIIVSDGISDVVPEMMIEDALSGEKDSQTAAEKLIELAENINKTGSVRAKADDKSVLIVEILEKESVISLAERQEEQLWLARVNKEALVPIIDGGLERGWLITGFDKKTGQVIVGKRGKSGILERKIDRDKFEQANSAEQRIAHSRNFDELIQALEFIGELPGSEGVYSAREIISNIGKIRREELSVNSMTRTAGLRQRVRSLLALEEAERLKMQV